MSEPGGASKPRDAERERRAVLARTIERRIPDIEQRWVARVQQEVAKSRRGITPTELKDAIGDYLARLASALREEGSVEAEGSTAWADVAREHALTRVRLGFDIEQLVREFVLLRRALFEVAREERLMSNDLQSERLADLIDAAIATSVKSYIESRDVAARRAQAEYIGFLTHELRNPLSTATLAVARLRQRPDLATASGQTRDLLDLLDRGLNQIRALVDETLANQRLEAREAECRPVDLTLGQVMEEATRAASLSASQKGIGFDVRIDPDVEVHIDPKLTGAALQNVVDNAVKFTDEGHVDVRAEDRPSEVIIHVYDNCDGLSAEELKTIFEPFKRATSGKGGTGLGLAIARRAMEAQGGRVGAASEGDRGCHFWLALPKPKH